MVSSAFDSRRIARQRPATPDLHDPHESRRQRELAIRCHAGQAERRLRQTQAVRPAEFGLFQVVLQHAVGANSQYRPEGGIDLRLAEIVTDKVPEQRWMFPWPSFPVRNGEICASPGKPTASRERQLTADDSRVTDLATSACYWGQRVGVAGQKPAAVGLLAI
jgi:hypothetical protein